ncbi:ribonuclease P protein component 4 [Candidatus Nanohalobium constans]|uniref:ribonuclease P protein component 4 n=1 Tax=Candidatus Nanohalobium constans TaxID=2565781 RepID=UPI001C3DE4F3|nr:ribonuclease P [Candidatus Nanohalobium constans]
MGSQRIAEERIRILFNQAEEKFDSEPELSDRYMEIAQRIGERTQTSIPGNLKKHFCSSCGSYWRHGDNCEVRINSENQLIEYKCLKCGEKQKHGY